MEQNYFNLKKYTILKMSKF